MKPMLSVAEVADELGLSTGTVYLLIRLGLLPHYRFHRSYRVARTDLDSYKSRQRRVGLMDDHATTAEGDRGDSSPGCDRKGTNTPPFPPSAL